MYPFGYMFMDFQEFGDTFVLLTIVMRSHCLLCQLYVTIMWNAVVDSDVWDFQCALNLSYLLDLVKILNK